jgi:DNA-binding response OmpR family regulator/DNA-binding CsgD family transcriptional regulator
MAEPEDVRDIVLVVDDSPETLGLLTDALEDKGVTVLVATSGERALEAVRRVTPDVILMDAVMPGVDGFETSRRLKADPALAHVPIIFMTGLSETEHIVEGLAAGGVDYLTKPIEIDELLARIRVHLANARAAQTARVALDAAGRYLVAADSRGRILWATPQALRLLESGTGTATALPQAAMTRREARTLPPEGVAIAIGGGRTLHLSALGQVGKDEFLFRLATAGRDDGEVLRARYGLTAREAEVLVWIGRGKPNRDIGEILGLSPRTVNKHLEQIYVKLGVENRASAAVIAARSAGES